MICKNFFNHFFFIIPLLTLLPDRSEMKNIETLIVAIDSYLRIPRPLLNAEILDARWLVVNKLKDPYESFVVGGDHLMTPPEYKKIYDQKGTDLIIYRMSIDFIAKEILLTTRDLIKKGDFIKKYLFKIMHPIQCSLHKGRDNNHLYLQAKLQVSDWYATKRTTSEKSDFELPGIICSASDRRKKKIKPESVTTYVRHLHKKHYIEQKVEVKRPKDSETVTKLLCLSDRGNVKVDCDLTVQPQIGPYVRDEQVLQRPVGHPNEPLPLFCPITSNSPILSIYWYYSPTESDEDRDMQIIYMETAPNISSSKSMIIERFTEGVYQCKLSNSEGYAIFRWILKPESSFKLPLYITIFWSAAVLGCLFAGMIFNAHNPLSAKQENNTSPPKEYAMEEIHMQHASTCPMYNKDPNLNVPAIRVVPKKVETDEK
ncbi:hypothetical protein SNEBB_005685 [Seison nebaliae]|nr:hypothetical protein SNEBB_005685 [Seison nebaliae]